MNNTKLNNVACGDQPAASALLAAPPPAASAARCADHDWPEGPHGTDMDGSCTKCGMSFQRYIHTECP